MLNSAKRSAGLLMFRRQAGRIEVFLVHPGGPFWASKNEGVWTIPKGEYADHEEPLAAARREFHEETGFASSGTMLALGSVRQKSGKTVTAWAFEGDCAPLDLVSNLCEVEWPPQSGKTLVIPEVDRGDWFELAAARRFIRAEHVELLDSLERQLQQIEEDQTR